MTFSPALVNSFNISYFVLVGLTLVTFIEAMRTNNPRIRHILNLETTVSLVAGIVYGIFVKLANDEKVTTDLSQITKYRYMDWYITTPMLLLVLLLFFNFYNKKELSIGIYALVIACNFTMLIFGHLGESGKIKKNIASIVGFVAYLALLTIVWFSFLHTSDIHHHKLVFVAFAIIWTLYGVAYMLNEENKNLMYNILDVLSKGMFGIFMWFYYGGVATL